MENQSPEYGFSASNILRKLLDNVPLIENHPNPAIVVRFKPRIVYDSCGARKDGEYECNEWCLRPHDIHVVLHVHEIVLRDKERRLINRW